MPDNTKLKEVSEASLLWRLFLCKTSSTLLIASRYIDSQRNLKSNWMSLLFILTSNFVNKELPHVLTKTLLPKKLINLSF